MFQICALCGNLQQLEREVLAGGSAQQVRDDEEAAAGDHLLLYRGRRLHQLADEAHQLRAERLVLDGTYLYDVRSGRGGCPQKAGELREME